MLVKWAPDEYCRFEWFWGWRPVIPESIDVLKYNSFLADCISINVCASTSITMSLKRATSHPTVTIILLTLIKTKYVNSFSPIQIGLKCGDIIQMIIAELRENWPNRVYWSTSHWCEHLDMKRRCLTINKLDWFVLKYEKNIFMFYKIIGNGMA